MVNKVIREKKTRKMQNVKLILGVAAVIAVVSYMKRRDAVVTHDEKTEAVDTINARRTAALGRAKKTGNYAEFMNKYNRHYQVNVAHGV